MKKLILILTITFYSLITYSKNPSCEQLNSFLKIGEKYHFSKPSVNEESIVKAGTIYIKYLDPSLLFLTKKEFDSIIVDLNKNSINYLNQYNKNPCKIFKKIENKLSLGEKRYFKFVKNALELGPEDSKISYLKERLDLTDLKKHIISLVRSNLFKNKDNLKEIKEYYIKSDSFLNKNYKKRSSLIIKSFYKSFDPHSDYLTDSESKHFDNSLSGNFVGLGVKFTADYIGIKIEDLINGSPAFDSGEIKPGFHILKVNNKKININNIDDFSEIMSVPEGSVISLEILNDKKEKKKIELITAKFPEKETRVTSQLKILDNKKILIINIPSFYYDESNKTGCAKDFLSEYEKNKDSDIIIMDLRNNLGGHVGQALELSGYFIGNKIVLYAKEDGKVEPLYSHIDKEIIKKPLVILTNRESASASEIVSGALKDYGKALVLGDESTYGKGTMQTLYSHLKKYGLGTIKLTSTKFYLPNGESNQLKGVIPDIIIPNPYENKDFNESRNDYALPWDQIDIVEKIERKYQDFTKLKKLSEKRVSNDSRFFKLEKEVDLKKNEDFILDESIKIATDYLNFYDKK